MGRALWVVACCLVLLAGVSGCTNPYDPAQRAIGGGLVGAGAGAAIGAAAAGGHGAALGAAIGGVTGALAGVATTPPPPGYYGYRYRYRRYAHHRHRHRCHDCRHTAGRSWANPAPN